MKDIEKMLKKYDFFEGKNFKIFSIQDYGRKSKFKMKMDGKYYTLILQSERIEPYINKLKVLGDNFKTIIGFQYLSEDKKVLVLDYFGNNKGIDLVKIDSNYIIDDFVVQLKDILDSIHSNKQKYVDFSENNFKSWKEYYLHEINSKITSIYEQHLITNEVKQVLSDKLENSSKIYINFQPTFIHADITPLNVCVDIENNDLYLIDFDDFKIGDPLMDISRIINCKNMSKIFSLLVDKYYYKYESNINHLFYTLRVHVNWYNHIIEKKQENIYNLESAKQDILNTIDKILNHK